MRESPLMPKRPFIAYGPDDPSAVGCQWKVTQGEGGAWIGVCDELQITIQSPTRSELLEDMTEVQAVLLIARRRRALASNKSAD